MVALGTDTFFEAYVPGDPNFSPYDDKKVNSISKEERRRLSALLKAFPLTITSFRPLEEAIITRGGVAVKEINPATMESKLVSGLFFAGESIVGADRGVCPLILNSLPAKGYCLWRSCLRSLCNHKQVCIALTYSQHSLLLKREIFSLSGGICAII